MELHQLRYIRAIARSGGFTRAAEQEGVAQPAISKQVRLLEEELGVRLFDRIGRTVKPTQAGDIAIRYAHHVLDALDDLRLELDDVTGLARGEVRICATETVMDYLLPAALAELRLRHPGIRVSAEMLGTDDAVALLLQSSVDVAIVTLPLVHPDLTVEHLFTEDVVLLVPYGDPLAARASISLKELADRDLLLSMPGHGLRATIEAACARIGFVPHAVLEVRSQEALIRLVERGVGLSFAPRLCVQHARRAVHICTVSDPALQRRIGWAVRTGRHVSRAVHELVALLAPHV